MNELRMSKEKSESSLVLRPDGFSLVEAMVGVSMLTILVASSLELSQIAFNSPRNLQLTAARDGLINDLRQTLMVPSALYAISEHAANAELKKCAIGSHKTDAVLLGCTGGTAIPLTIPNLLGGGSAVLAGPEGGGALFDKELKPCTGDCPLQATASFIARCSGAATACTRAAAIEVVYSVRSTPTAPFVLKETKGTLSLPVGNYTSGACSNGRIMRGFRENGLPECWVWQFGTDRDERVFGIKTDADGNTYITGSTLGSFPGSTYAGGSLLFGDAFLAKIDPSQKVLWVRQFGVASSDYGKSLAIDSDGMIYVLGYIYSGSMTGSGSGYEDVFIAKFDPQGTKLWIRQLTSPGTEAPGAIAVDAAGDVYITGETSIKLGTTFYGGLSDAWVAKYSSSGNQIWIKQLGSSTVDKAQGIAIDPSGLYLYATGYTLGTLPGQSNAGWADIFIAKLSAATGGTIALRQFGTNRNEQQLAGGTVADSAGNVFVAYTRIESIDYGNPRDVVVRKFDGSLVQQWSKEFATPGAEEVGGTAVDADGNLYLAGKTTGTFAGYTNAGASDVFAAKLAPDGNLVWLRQFGTPNIETSTSIALITKPDGIYPVMTGEIRGEFNGEINPGFVSRDYYLSMIDPRGR